MRIRNNSKYINPTGMQKATYDFYTGNDAEMKLRMENEWYMRIYWQGVETFDKGGYVIFDTFTYDDEHLPRLKHYFPEDVLISINPEDGEKKYFGNYGCFNREHFAKFMKDLRSALEYDGYDVKNNIKYCYTTEYGTQREYEDRRGVHIATMRPHYHLMLFVIDRTLTSDVLNDYIGKLWKYGFHGNGKNFAELRRNTFHAGLSDTDMKVRLRGLANYIGKYMHKDADYEKVIGSRIDAIAYKVALPFMYGCTEKLLKLNKDKYKKWKEVLKIARKQSYKLIATFHGQSQHFGEFALVQKDFNIEEVAKTGKMRMPDKDKVVKFIPIPMYYRRKLFYEQVMKDDGKLMWKLKDDDLSHTFYKNATYRQAAVLSGIYTNVYNELKVADRIKVDSWMKGRTMNNLAVYSVFFKDCFFDCDLTGITPDDTLEIRMAQDFSTIEGNLLNIGRPLYYIDQNSREDFEYFDDVLKVFDSYLHKRREQLNETYNEKVRERKALTAYGIKTKK